MKWLTKRVLKKVVLEAALPALLGRFPAERIVASLLVHLLREVPRGGMKADERDKWRRRAGRLREASKAFDRAVLVACEEGGGAAGVKDVLHEALWAWAKGKVTPAMFRRTYREVEG